MKLNNFAKNRKEVFVYIQYIIHKDDQFNKEVPVQSARNKTKSNLALLLLLLINSKDFNKKYNRIIYHIKHDCLIRNFNSSPNFQ